MELEVGARWDVSAEASGDLLADQSYGHGRIGVAVETYIPLFSEPEETSPVYRPPGAGGAVDDAPDPEDRLDPAASPAGPVPVTSADGPLIAPSRQELNGDRDARVYYFNHRPREPDQPDSDEESRYLGRYRKRGSADAEEALRADAAAKEAEAAAATEAETGAEGAATSSGANDGSIYPHVDDDGDGAGDDGDDGAGVGEPASAGRPRGPKKLAPRRVYPFMAVAADMAFDRHAKNLGSSDTTSDTDQMSEFTIGGKLRFVLSPDFSFFVSGDYSSYSASISTFTKGLPTAPASGFLMPSSALAAFQPHPLVFGSLVGEEGMSYAFAPDWTVGLAINEVFYAATGAGLGIGVAPTLSWAISRDFVAGLGAGFESGGPASGTFVGLINFSYLF
jgi:hypothetical protein